MSERNMTVDIARGIGILTVVSGHANSGSTLYPFSPYSFHMPLFFFLSGIFFHKSHEKDIVFILKSVKSLLVPSTI